MTQFFVGVLRNIVRTDKAILHEIKEMEKK